MPNKLNAKVLRSEEFFADIISKTRKAKKLIYMQFLTFEGDSRGLELSNELSEAAKRGVEVKLQVDYFTDNTVSDKPSKSEEVKEELQSTVDMLNRLEAAGVEVLRTNPYGPFKMFILARNHRKIVVIDDYSYLGGVNISDHNIEWVDFMIQFTDHTIKTELEDLFLSSFNKTKPKRYKKVLLNKDIEKTVNNLIAGADKSLVISSPYILDRYLIRRLKQSKIAAKIFTTRHNNKAVVRLGSRHIKHLLQKNGHQLTYYTDFSHGKFIVVDDKQLLIGSSNFDFSSLKYMQEVGILIEDEKFIRDFKKQIVSKSNAEEAGLYEMKPWSFTLNSVYEIILRSYILIYRLFKFITMDRDKKILFCSILFLAVCGAISLAGIILGISFLEFAGVMAVGSTFIPVPADAYILSFAENQNALTVAAIAGFINAVVVIGEKYWFIEALKHKRFKKLNHFFDNSKIMPYIDKSMFMSLLIGAFSPIPFEFFRVIASKRNYSNTKYFLATFLGRGFRYYLLATSSALLVDVGALNYVIAALLILFVWGLYQSIKKWKSSGKK